MSRSRRSELAVSLGTRRVGTVVRDGSFGIRFAYGDDIVAAAAEGDLRGMLSVALPPTRQRYGKTQSAAFFDGLLPEDVIRDRIADDRRIDRRDTYALLAALAGDTAGAVITSLVTDVDIEAEDGSIPDPPTTLTEEGLESLVADLARHPLGIRTTNDRFSLAGVQGKLMLTRRPDGWALPSNAYPSTHILKPTTTDPAVVVNEGVCMATLRRAGIPTPDNGLVRIGGAPAFLIQRYDRRETDAGTQRIHQEDLCQATSVAPAAKYFNEERNTAVTYERAARILDAHSTTPGIQRLRLFQLAVASFLLGNSDQHGKNLSFVHHDGHVTLAPAYDIVATQAWGTQYAAALALPYGGVQDPDEVDAQAMTRLATGCGMAPSGVARSIAEIVAKIRPALETTIADVRAAGFDDPIVDAVQAAFTQRSKQLLG